MEARTERREGSVLLWGANVITVVVPPHIADLVPDGFHLIMNCCLERH